MKECVICQMCIENKQDYFKVDLFTKGKLKGTDYAHRLCWAKKQGNERQMTYLIKELTERLRLMGVLPNKISLGGEI